MTIRQIIITNDDGVNAEGIQTLGRIMRQFGQVTVVAPESERSGYGHSITTKLPIRMVKLREEEDFRVFSVNGSPVDCVKIALERLYTDAKPDIVISGINKGANVGQDLFYSGTMGAAREAVLYGIPAIAISAARASNEEVYFDRVEEIIRPLIEKILKLKFPKHVLLNINIPAVEPSDVKGIKVVDMDINHKRFDFTDYQDPKGHKIYWMNSLYQTSPGRKDSDHYLVKNGYVTLSPVQVMINNQALIERLEEEFY